MAGSQLSQKDYLKKYLSFNTDDKKKKKKKKPVNASHERFRVVDDDIDINNMRPLDEDELDLYNLAEDAPQIAGIIDERPDSLRSLEEFRGSKRWKVMSDENGIEDIKVTAIESVGKQVVTSSSRNCGKSDLSPQRGYDSTRESKKTCSTRIDLESDFDVSPPRKSRISSDSDVSPPRKLQAKRGSDELGPRKNNKGNDSDSSPPRKYKHSLTLSPKRRNTAASPTMKEKNKRDLSPVRKNKENKNLSPIRRKTHDSDLSPVRRSKNEAEKSVSGLRKTKCDVSPPKKNNHHSDLSPPRKFRRSEEYDGMSPRNSRKNDSKTDRNQRRYSDADPSPPRKTSKHGSPSVQSRKDSSGASASVRILKNDVVNQSRTSDKYEHYESVPVKSKQGDFRESSRQNKDRSVVMGSVSPSRHCDRSESPRKKDKLRSSPELSSRKSRSHAHSVNSSDNSPERLSKRQRNVSSPLRSDSQGKRGHQDKGDKMKGKMEKTLDGKRAGLQAAEELRQEISDFKQREDELFAQMGDEVSGKGAAVVMRDRKTGKRRNLEEEAKQKQEEDERTAQRQEKYSKWGKGLKQVEEQMENLQQALHVVSKPLARYADDKDLDQHLRNQEREGDPMLEYIRSKKTQDTTRSKPKYEGSFLPNRFGIPPGHRWDGVDRSNGYEKQWFERQNSRRAIEEEAYKWSTSDM